MRWASKEDGFAIYCHWGCGKTVTRTEYRVFAWHLVMYYSHTAIQSLRELHNVGHNVTLPQDGRMEHVGVPANYMEL
jgi:hypothetical protein